MTDRKRRSRPPRPPSSFADRDAAARQGEARRADFKTFADALGKYLESIGWRALVVGSPAIEGVEVEGLGRYRFVVNFSGGRIKERT